MNNLILSIIKLYLKLSSIKFYLDLSEKTNHHYFSRIV